MVTLRASHWSQGDEGGGRRCRRREGGLARAASFGTLRIDCRLDPAWSIPNCRRRRTPIPSTRYWWTSTRRSSARRRRRHAPAAKRSGWVRAKPELRSSRKAPREADFYREAAGNVLREHRAVIARLPDGAADAHRDTGDRQAHEENRRTPQGLSGRLEPHVPVKCVCPGVYPFFERGNAPHPHG